MGGGEAWSAVPHPPAPLPGLQGRAPLFCLALARPGAMDASRRTERPRVKPADQCRGRRAQSPLATHSTACSRSQMRTPPRQTDRAGQSPNCLWSGRAGVPPHFRKRALTASASLRSPSPEVPKLMHTFPPPTPTHAAHYRFLRGDAELTASMN